MLRTIQDLSGVRSCREDGFMKRLACMLVVALNLLSQGARADDAIIVLDASGSMWGQIQGKSRIDIAREVMAGLLAQLPADKRLGLVAYGHRRKGDCADIEELIPVGTDRAAIVAAVNRLSPKGKTPLSDAVSFAAKKLRYTEEKATVVLVSDGEETCDADPCAVGRELEAAGIGLTVHVVGFGLEKPQQRAGLICLAEATGGRYFDAANAAELTRALTETVVAAPAPVPQPTLSRVTLRATELEGGPEIAAGLVWSLGQAGGQALFTQSDAGVVTREIPPGDYTVTVERPADGLKGTGTLQCRAGAERTLTIVLEPAFEAKLQVTPAGAAPAGSEVSIAWQGPDRDGDYLTITAVGAPATSYLDYKYTRSGNPLRLTLPSQPGDYEIRYVLGRPYKVLAREAIAVTDVTATVIAAATAAAGSSVTVAWTGTAHNGDFITIVPPGSPVSFYMGYFDVRQSGGSAPLVMPVEAGSYEIRYVMQGGRILATSAIEVTAASASLDAPASGTAGAPVNVAWTGPNAAGDFITITKPDANEVAYLSYANARDGSPARLQLPAEPGAYEFRYVLLAKKVIARRPIEVTTP
jgi:Ca-activated chloride channel family protein